MSRVRRVPQRTCVGCRQVEGKRGMIRVVRTPEGGVAVDVTGKASGRGAYVHPQAECVRAALAGERLARALKTGLAPEVVERLRADLEHAVARADLLRQMAARRAEASAPPQGRGTGRRR